MTKTELAKELVGKAKAGDKSAFGELYAEYSEQIKRFVMKMNITELDASLMPRTSWLTPLLRLWST